MRIAVIAVSNPKGEVGGAEKFYKGLADSLCAKGHQAEVISVLSDESTFESIEESYLRFYDLDLSAYDGVISTKSPSYMIRHPNHVCYLLHTMRVFYDMFEVEFPHPSKSLIRQRDLIIKLDSSGLVYPRIKKLAVIGNEVRNRLLKYNNIDSEVIHIDLDSDDFYSDEPKDYIFFPSRLHRWKRVDLAIRAMKYVKCPLKLVIAGTGEDEEKFKSEADGDARIIFLGRLSESNLRKYYAGAIAVAFLPIREDFGFITLEAFRSSKPVITCIDSGEPVYIIKENETGFICPPDPKSIAEKFNFLFQDRDTAKSMGIAGKKSVSHISWANISEKMLGNLGFL